MVIVCGLFGTVWCCCALIVVCCVRVLCLAFSVSCLDVVVLRCLSAWFIVLCWSFVCRCVSFVVYCACVRFVGRCLDIVIYCALC